MKYVGFKVLSAAAAFIFLAALAPYAACSEDDAASSGAQDGAAVSAHQTDEDQAMQEARKFFTQGLIKMNHGHTEEAEKNFLKTLELNPSSFNSRMFLGKIYEQRQDWQGAAEQYRQAIKIREMDPRPYLGLMGAYLDLGEPSRAVEVGEDALDKGIPPRGIENTLGWAHYKMGEMDKAEVWFLAAREHTKDDTAQINNLGLVYFTQGRYDEALALFNEADRLNPSSVFVPYYKALTYMKLGDKASALEALRRGIEKDPELSEKAAGYNARFFPHTDPGDLSPLFDELDGDG